MVSHLDGMEMRIGPVRPGSKPDVPHKTPDTGKPAPFQDILGYQIRRQDDLKFSVHARERIRLRNIPLDGREVDRLKDAVQQVAEKGGRESLILMSSTAFLVSVANRTVITAVDQENLKDNVFTNIDSAIII